MIVFCSYCNKELNRKPSSIRERTYCNASCQLKNEYKLGIRNKNTITKKANEAVKRNGFPQRRGLTREKTSNWKGGRNIHRDYVRLRVGNQYVKEHRHVWEQNYGKIPDGWQIHHINGDTLDNRIENLQALSNTNHQKLHNRLRKRDKYGKFLKSISK